MEINQIKWAEINLDHLIHNLEEIRKRVGADVKICAVVKANGYGHGALEISEALIQGGADMLGVSSINEAIELRKMHKKVQLIVLGYMLDELIEDAISHDVIQTVASFEQAKKISEIAARMHMGASVHIKIDTGMHRIGIWCDENAVDEVAQIYNLPNIKVNGIFSHFAVADEADKSFTKLQWDRFQWLLNELIKKKIKIPIKHISNSAGTLEFPEMDLDMVRPGLILYGCYPSKEVGHDSMDLKPVMSLKTRVSFLKTMQVNSGISYGLKYEGKQGDRIATIPVGYADGLVRSFDGDCKVSIHGISAAIVGNVCMDQCMIDVSHISQIQVGDEVTLFGDATTGVPSVEDLSDISGRINYEMLCSIGRRVPRVYIYKGKVVKITNYLV